MISHWCGCYHVGFSNTTLEARTRDYLPLLNSEAHTTILSTTSKTVLKQSFANPSPSESIKECIYNFPLYDGVSVVGFTCKVGLRTLRGLVKEKAKAEAIFDAAVARGETAGLLVQATEASDVFSTRLGNIPAGETVIVEITYIGELKHNDLEGIRFTIPTNIAPRYGSGPRSYNSARRGSFGSTSPAEQLRAGLPVQPHGGIQITVDVNLPEGLSIKRLQSPSHPIAVSIGTISTGVQADLALNKASATLSLGTAALEKDFVLIVHSKDTGIPKALLETHPTIPNHRALMATLVPKFSLPPLPSEIVFVADRSGSMRQNIPMLVSALRVFLKSLPIGIKFNICSFGSGNTFLWPQSKSYSSETLQICIDHISTFDSNYGGTETYGAIKATIERRLTDLPLEIVLLTDGDIWSQEQLFEYVNEQVNKTDGNIRVFPLGIGSGVSHALIEGLARAGNGFAQAVQDGERLESSAIRMLRGALTPHITDYTLEVKYEQEDDDFEVIEKVTESMKTLLADSEPKALKLVDSKPKATISLYDPSASPDAGSISLPDAGTNLPNIQYPKLLQAPHKIPSLFAFARTTVYLLMDPKTIQRNPTSVVLRATSSHGPVALEIPVEVLPKPDRTIHQLAARKASQDLEEGRGWIYDGVLIKDNYPSHIEGLVRKEAIRLGETFQVVNKWCSFVAVTYKDRKVKVNNLEENTAALLPPESSSNSSPYDNMMEYSVMSVDLEENLEEEHEHIIADSFCYSPLSPPAAHASSPPPSSQAAAGRAYSGRAYSRRAAAANRVHASFASPPPPAANRGNAFFAPPPPPAPIPFHASFAPPPHRISQSSSEDLFRSTLNQPNIDSVVNSSPSSSRAYVRGGPQDRSARLDPTFAPRVHPLCATAPKMAEKQQNLQVSQFAKMASFNRNRLLPVQQAQQAQQAASFGSPDPAPRTLGFALESDTDRVLALIDLQAFDGSWGPDREQLSPIMGIAMPQAPAGVDEKIWVTMIVIRYLEVRMSDEDGLWVMVVQKARAYVQENAHGAVGELEELAEAVVGNK